MNLDPAQIRALGSVQPRAAEQIDGMAARDETAEDFLEVKLGTAGLGIPGILPVEDEYPH